jgi:hypothetical protein
MQKTAVIQNPVVGPRAANRGHARIHLLLSVQSLVVLLVSINRLTALFQGYAAPNEFLRWIEINNMLVLPLISTAAFFLLKEQIEVGGATKGHPLRLWLNLAFIVGVYLLGASYGNHEVTNYLHTRFCPDGNTGRICQIIIFNDDEFSHWIFFSGFVLVNAALLLLQALSPSSQSLSRLDWFLLAVNGLIIGAGIFANLAFERIGLDLYIVAFLAALSLILWRRRGAQPLSVYYSSAYTIGLLGTALYKMIR